MYNVDTLDIKLQAKAIGLTTLSLNGCLRQLKEVNNSLDGNLRSVRSSLDVCIQNVSTMMFDTDLLADTLSSIGKLYESTEREVYENISGMDLFFAARTGNNLSRLLNYGPIKDTALKSFFENLTADNLKKSEYFMLLLGALASRDISNVYDVLKNYITWLKDDTLSDLKAFIPHTLSNEALVGLYEMLRRGTLEFTNPNGGPVKYLLHKLYDTTLSKLHYEKNCFLLDNEYTPGSFIENQANWGEILFGISLKELGIPKDVVNADFGNMAYSGCEIIAVANALTNMGDSLSKEEMANLISHFERDGMALDGIIGTSPKALNDYFISNGYKTEYTTSNKVADINHIGNDYDTVVVTAYNDKDNIMGEIHTVCITKNSDGSFTVHNGYEFDKQKKVYKERNCDNQGNKFMTLDAAIKCICDGENSQSIMVMGVEPKSEEQS